MKVLTVTAALRRSMPKSAADGRDAGWVTAESVVQVAVEDDDDPENVANNARAMARLQVKAEMSLFFPALAAEIDGLYLGLPDMAPDDPEEVF